MCSVWGVLLALCLQVACVEVLPVPSPDDGTGIPLPDDGTRVTIEHVIDGDTVALDDGRRVRYIGINTPERGQFLYDEAAAFNRHLVEGAEAWMVLDVQTIDQYGRTLAYLWVGDTFVNHELIRQGFANVYTSPPNVRYSQDLQAAEQVARDSERGLWALSEAHVTIQDIVYDAPGPDPENPNGEWVIIANDGLSTADLTGYTIKDEANHIYTFPEIRLKQWGVVKLYSGQGTDTDTALHWGLENDSVWNNGGDTAYLRDAEGRLVDSYGY